jgi:hypothetical protein
MWESDFDDKGGNVLSNIWVIEEKKYYNLFFIGKR